MNRWNIIALYAAIICLLSMGSMLFNGITAAQSSLKLLLPWYLEAGTYRASNAAFQNNAVYISYRCPPLRKDAACALADKSDDEITALREYEATESRTRELGNARMQAMKSLMDSAIDILIALLFFVFHWRIANRALRTASK